MKLEITDEYIKYVFDYLKLGKVNDIELINNTLKIDNRIYSAYLNIDLYDTEQAKEFNYKLNSNQDIRIYYKKKSYWIIKKDNINENMYINPYILYKNDDSKESLMPLPLSNTKNIFSTSNEINFEEIKQIVKSDSFQNSLILADNELKKTH